MDNTLLFITSNNNKVSTIKRLLGECPIVIEASNLNIMEPQLDSSLEIAAYKAKNAFELMQKPVLVEDSSFYINALDGFPGPYLNYVIRKLQPQGLLNLMNGKSDRSCYFISVAVLVTASGEQIVFSGDPEEGHLSDGVSTVSNGFGWSPISKIFVPKGYKNSLSELSTDEIKQLNKQERNTSALSKVAIWLENNYPTLFNK